MRALLVDAAGTLLHPAEPVATTYARFAREHGCDVQPEEIRFREALAAWSGGPRYEGRARPFWRFVVREATGCDDPALFEALYAWYERPHAWRVPADAPAAFDRLRSAGLAVAVVSNWDTRLRPLLRELGLIEHLDAVFVSAEVGLEKPDPALFALACQRLGVAPSATVHVGDDPVHDLQAARQAGCEAWAWGDDVVSFTQVARRLGA